MISFSQPDPLYVGKKSLKYHARTWVKIVSFGRVRVQEASRRWYTGGSVLRSLISR